MKKLVNFLTYVSLASNILFFLVYVLNSLEYEVGLNDLTSTNNAIILLIGWFIINLMIFFWTKSLDIIGRVHLWAVSLLMNLVGGRSWYIISWKEHAYQDIVYRNSLYKVRRIYSPEEFSEALKYVFETERGHLDIYTSLSFDKKMSIINNIKTMEELRQQVDLSIEKFLTEKALAEAAERAAQLAQKGISAGVDSAAKLIDGTVPGGSGGGILKGIGGFFKGIFDFGCAHPDVVASFVLFTIAAGLGIYYVRMKRQETRPSVQQLINECDDVGPANRLRRALNNNDVALQEVVLRLCYNTRVITRRWAEIDEHLVLVCDMCKITLTPTQVAEWEERHERTQRDLENLIRYLEGHDPMPSHKGKNRVILLPDEEKN